ncbi:MAG: ATP-binding cassette domain-containing protein [Chlamydiales bacterium]|nr:ATP-binding cassette domain-containing protein [Chlamydiales bacterium]
MFKVENLSKSIGGKKILSNITFEVDHGQIAVFLGGSGVGKSTLLRVLNHLETYDSGSFSLDNVLLNLAQVNKEHIMGMVFQSFNLFEHLSVEENIILALVKLKEKSPQEASLITQGLLERYGLDHKAKSSVHKLSGGQKQRVAIARTVALNPKIICFDEPTSALDPRLTKQVAKYIEELAAQGRIVLLATHDINLIRYFPCTLFLMQEGSIVESVSNSEYHAEPSKYPKLCAFLN